MDLNAIADGKRTIPRNFPMPAGWAAGDGLAVSGVIQIEDVPGDWEINAAIGTAMARVYVINQDGASIATVWERNPGLKSGPGVYNIGPFFRTFTIPAGVSGFFFWLSLTVLTASRYRMRVGATDLGNLTKLGIPDIAPSPLTVP